MRQLSSSLLILLLAATNAHGADVVQAPDRNAGLALIAAENGWAVFRAGEAPLPVALRDGFHPAALAALDDGWLIAGSVASGATTDLVLLRGGSDGIRAVAPPSGRIGPRRGGPVVLVERGRLAGLVWVEGERQDDLRVRAAEWLGTAWGPIEEVSPGGGDTPVRGAQLALAGTILADGDWLLLWAAFDGQDDEIVWSRRRDRAWGPPRRLAADNRVPDITPTVMTTTNGALAAWSVFDEGHYRLRLGRFEDGAWTVERAPTGKGSLDPQALTLHDRLLVLHRSIIPDGWSVLELDRGGTLLRLGFVGEATSYRPAVLAGDDGEIELVWPGAAAGGAAVRRHVDWEGP